MQQQPERHVAACVGPGHGPWAVEAPWAHNLESTATAGSHCGLGSHGCLPNSSAPSLRGSRLVWQAPQSISHNLSIVVIATVSRLCRSLYYHTLECCKLFQRRKYPQTKGRYMHRRKNHRHNHLSSSIPRVPFISIDLRGDACSEKNPVDLIGSWQGSTRMTKEILLVQLRGYVKWKEETI